jgi:hypothetical protein
MTEWLSVSAKIKAAAQTEVPPPQANRTQNLELRT